MATKKTTAKVAEETVKETKTTAKKAPAKKTAPKKVAPKKPAAVAAATEAAKTAKTTTAPAKKAEKETAEVQAKVNFFVEFGGVQVSVDEVVNNIKATIGKDAKEISVYLKPEESKAYFVADGETAAMDVYFC